MALNDVSIRALKPQNRSYLVADEKGLCVEVAVSGSKLWRFRYRFAGRPRKLALGPYPEVSLKEARRLRDEARSAVREGIDPGVERKNAKLTARFNAANTFGAVAEEYIEHKLVKEGRAAVTVEKAKWLLLQMKPLWDQPLVEIKPAEVFGVLRRLEGQRKHETAKRCRSFSSRVFRYAAATGRAESDPAAMLAGQLITPKVKHHAAILDPRKLGELLRSIDAFEGAPITRLALQVAPHVMARPGELRQATWDEFDLDGKIWRIKPERMKMTCPPLVPRS